MYFDRRIDDELAQAIGASGPLSWLMDHVYSKVGSTCRSHVQFRRDRGERRYGSIQLYWGRTSPLEFKLRRGRRVLLSADTSYKAASGQLFAKPVEIDRLGAQEDGLRAHLARIQKLLAESPNRRQSFVKHEAVCHAGLMRRYGHFWRLGDPLVLIDSEAQIGYGGLGRRDADDAEIRKQFRLGDLETMPRKLDALGVLPTGDLALVEVKDVKGSIDRAIVQAAVHLVRFSRLMAHGALRGTLQAMIDQKTAAGVIPRGCPRLGATPRIVPCIAAPVVPAGWPANWNQAIGKCSPELRRLLSDLWLIRLDSDGRILDVRSR
ncbi:MAG: hypothetical protein F4X40_09115 [Chloroflexi bacterium]|nr:hypothetical protein [Chloroflexota bacterium]